MSIAIGSDHAGFIMKEKISKYLKSKNFKIIDKGAFSENSVDYAEFGHRVGNSIIEGESSKGIIICGTGIGISIAANKIKGIRAALCTSPSHAEMSRLHNDSNILALGSRMTEYKKMIQIIDIWLDTNFEGGRHLKRINKIEVL